MMANARAILSLLQGCNSMRKLHKIHAHILINGYQHNPSISEKLLNFCAVSVSGSLAYAQLVFHRIHNPQTPAWNSMIRGFSQSPSPLQLQAIVFYNHMLSASHARPDTYTFSFLLKACEEAKEEGKCREVHGFIIRFGYDQDVVLCTNLIRSYAGNGLIETAHKVFEEMPARDLVSWNSMISCYCQTGLHEEALKMYDQMRISNVGFDGFTLVSLLSSCAHVGALHMGVQMHRFAGERRLVENIFVGNALIDMYAKCGSLASALSIFNSMPKRDVFTWNSMIVGYGVHGRGDEAITFFGSMLMAGVRPNSITFLGLLCGCSHQGLVKEGVQYFHMMSSEFNLKPGIKHYGCMVDLFGRAGKLKEALEVIRSSPSQHDPVLWRTLLGSCKIHRNVEIGEMAMRNLVQLGSLGAGDCVLLSGIYAEAKDLQGVARMRKLIQSRGIKTTPGWSWIEVGDQVHRFVVDDKSHPDSREIYRKLEEVIHRASLVGYAMEESSLVAAPESNTQEYCWETSTSYHSEKLAIAYGLARTPEGTSLLIVKNLRVCRDCHNFTKFVSKAFDREIIVRDRVRFHHFRGGHCSCKEFCHGAPYIPSTYTWRDTEDLRGTMWGSSTNGSGLTGCATQSSSPLGSTSTTAAAGSPSFGVGSSSFSHGWQKPDFGGSGSTSNQSESACQQTNSDFGSSSFGLSPPFCTSGTTFGISSIPNFSSGGPYGASTVSAFGFSSTPGLGYSSMPGLGSSSIPTFVASNTLAFKFGSAPSFSQSTSAFGTPHITSSTFGSTVFGRAAISDEHRGSRIAPYATTAERQKPQRTKMRGEDYQLGDKGGSNPCKTPNFGSGGPCGASTMSAFGTSSMPGFGSSSRPPFEASSTLAFGFCSTPLFGQPTSTFDVNAVGANPFPYGTQSSHFGPQITASTFGSMGFGKLASSDPSGGSRIAAYAATAEVDGTNFKQPAGKLKSISAVPVYRNKSHEELRWEDYQLGDKGGPYGASTVSAFGSSSMLAFGLSSTPALRFGSTPSFGQSSNAFVGSSVGTNPSSYGTQSSHFAEVNGPSCNQPAGRLQSISAVPTYRDKSHEELRFSLASQSVGRIGFGGSMTKSSPLGLSPTFSLSAINPFSSSTSSNPPKTPAFAASGFGPSLILPFSSSPFNASYTTNPFWTVSSSSAIPYVFEAISTPTFETSTSPPLVGALSSSAFRPSSSIFSHASALGATPTFTSGLRQTASTLGQGTAPSLGQSNILGIRSTVLGQNMFLSTPPLHPTSNEVGFGQKTSSLTTPQPVQAAQIGGTSNTNFGQTSAGVTNVLGQGTSSQL
ncbi:Pentatricopeptide repeat-containing protein [Vitis vinifera]|uniref:Pentatricopeptide repeat-containing protein n=1 Tax=Vitis vinifera TaxID=29760 RepID=A0A438GYP3_VITVI|nr:Pentatricopeptide repeat-containing protein [Vitis vinifera]